MREENEKKKAEIIEKLHEINTKLKGENAEPVAVLAHDVAGGSVELNTERLSPKDRKELVGVICTWDEQKNEKREHELSVEKRKLEIALKDYL